MYHPLSGDAADKCETKIQLKTYTLNSW